MRWNIRSKALPALLFLTALGGEARLLAQPPTQPPDARLARGPRFLLASAGGVHSSAIDASPIDASQVPILQQPISVHLENVTLEEALDAISTQSGLSLTYSRAVVPMDARVSLHAADLSLAAALTEVLSGAPVDVLVSTRGHAALVPQPPAPAQRPIPTGTLTGRVTQSGEPVAGVTVTATSTALGVVKVVTTDDEGNYELTDLPPGTYSLRLELEGLVPVVKDAEVSPDESTTVDIQMSLYEVQEDIVVTGSHIRGVTPVGSPLIVVDRAQIEASGYGRVQDLLETLPQNFSGAASEDFNADLGAENVTRGQAIDLRGLGASSTLVLVNGRRQPGGGTDGVFVDISSIAVSAIDRIEVLTDGASALYGSDAIGGVVNFVLRRDYEGVEVDVRPGAINDGAADEIQASVLGGRSWTGGNLLVGYQYSRRDALMAADAFYASRGADFREFGGSDNRSPRSNPGTIIDPTNFQPAFAIPEGQDGTNLTVADLILGQNFQDNVAGRAALPEQTQHSAFFTLSHELSDRFEIYTEGRYSQRDMTLLFGGETDILNVPATNPFYINPFGTTDPILVAYDFQKDFGPSTMNSKTETYTLAAGGIAQLAREWELNTVASYGRERNPWKWSNNHNFFTIADALADPDPATAFNPFGDGSNTNPATIESLRLTDLREGISTVASLTTIADGPILRLPAGWARLAVGADYRDESVESHFGFVGPGTDLPRSPFSVGDLERQVTAVFGELIVPLVGDEEGGPRVRKLEVGLAGRYEEYSDFGSTVNPKVGVNFMPNASVNLRGSWGTSFRAPRFNELSLNRSFSGTLFAAPDPQSPTGLSDILFMSGTNPDIEPETAEFWTAGVDLTPPRLRGLTVSATYFNLDYEDKIETGGAFADTLAFEDQWAEIITRNPTQDQIDIVCGRPDFSGDCPPTVAAIIDIRLRNLALVRVRGIDVDLGYQRSLGSLGDLDLGLTGTYMLTHDQAVSSTSPRIGILDIAFNPLALRLRGRAGWNLKRWHPNIFVNYTDAYEEFESGPKVDSWTTLDFGVSYDLPTFSGIAVALNVQNLLDEEPPFVNSFSGFDAANASDVGRSVRLSLSKSWKER